MWISFAYFTLWVVLRSFWVEKARYTFESSDSFFFSPFVGVVLVIIFGVVVFFNQFINLRLNEKMYPSKEPVNDSFETEKEIEENEKEEN
jgi:hypothetical protein